MSTGTEDAIRTPAAEGGRGAREFSWAVITPEAAVGAGVCEFLVVPTENGELGILAGHAALVACVVPGDLRITAAGATRTMTIGAGVVDVRDNEVRLLVRSAKP